MRIFIGRSPRSIVLSSNGYNLSFRRIFGVSGNQQQQQQNIKTPVVALKSIPDHELTEENGYVEIKNRILNGLLGLVSVNGDLFVAVITGVQKVGFPRWRQEDGHIVTTENVYKVLDVDFHSLDTPVFDSLFQEISEQNYEKLTNEHPCGAFKKLFSDGTFYFSRNFDISNVLKSHGLAHSMDYTIDNQDKNFIWNSNLVTELINWRSRIAAEEKQCFDGEFLTFLMRGFYKTQVVDMVDSLATITLVSRISAESKQNAFDLDGIDEDGRVSNFIETEIIVTTSNFIFSYTQVNGNVPLFWETTEGQLLYGRKLKLTKSLEHTQAAFDRHFDNIASKYGVVSVVNLMKPKSESQESLGNGYKTCADLKGIKFTNVDYGSGLLTKTPHKLLYLLKQDIYEFGTVVYNRDKGVYIGKQTGVFRISAFDSIERPNTVERLVSREVLELATNELSGLDITSAFLKVHDRLWSENYYWIERTYSKNVRNPGKYKKIYTKLFSSKIKLYDPLHSTISHHLRQRRSTYTFERNISVFAGTFNLSGKVPAEDLSSWIFPEPGRQEDMYVIGLEEVVELTPGRMLTTDPYLKQHWEKIILSHLNSSGERKYGCPWSSQLGAIMLMLFVSETQYPRVKHIEGDVKKTGFGGMTSNKGAVAVSFKYSATKFCFLVSHLAAGLENVEQRHNDYKTIVKNIRFPSSLRIRDHDAIIWMGDFNYRILMPNEEVRRLIVERKYGSLFEKDQLNQQMIAGEAFPYYNEMEINFDPTYKFDPGTKTYDTSEKMRIPAWTDRILSRGEVLKQLTYGCAPDILFSDHRPVYATFSAQVTVVDEQKKAALSSYIYSKIAEKLATINEEEKIAILNAGGPLIDGIDEESVSTVHEDTPASAKHKRTLKPPSSELRRWWLGNGKQVKVVLDVDSKQYMVNPKKPVNPFMENEEPLFVQKPNHHT
ncbi:hypothetical protein ZYGR_0N03970 [Zygosaccharomyces rouxii]|uniref:phosphoinositide 5-phosphatase n=2 Tax=Zygosaccharomyces rouxii TaxID=4956 RepID=C5DVU1_ZYGRC|nr:uncharacterized protein ZYRO0D09394g [Zygosaccharomyces rouxii]KAH9200820.1 Endonuclease/exonuclease/phosphatase [Zygosaccharomyces rouxii]GAV48992.1 hypothetical protein ZYGR_0N03970 [Zygosaccharomyces rouxii]CAR27910.1 ZYRO0D09394p [Zygosaccharomyces rouxii]